MKPLSSYSKEELTAFKNELDKKYSDYKSMNLKLDMSRGKPGKDQLDLSNELLFIFKNSNDFYASDGFDCRNYGQLEGIPEARELFSQLLEVAPSKIIIGGNSSLNMMFDAIARAMTNGVLNSEKPWGKYDKIKFLCPVPGYDRHFSICQHFGIEMINIKMNQDGPDMDMVEKLVSEDDTIKGIWCVPMYSNPEGKTYSNEVVRRFANLKPKALDFKIFWDNAYAFHHLSDEKDSVLNIIDECEKAGNPDIVFEFASTSKISFPGGGIAAIVASDNNINEIKKQLFVQTIGPDKLNQLRHVKYFGDANGVYEHMKKHAEILKPKFEIVLNALSCELDGLEIASYNNPRGGYFISLDVPEGCAKRTVQLAKEAGVVLTGAGATFPYGKDPLDRNIRIAPTFPPVNELEMAMNLLCLCLKIAALEKCLSM